MAIAQACAITLIFHELYYYSLEGKDSFLIDFMPALGVSLGGKAKPLLHLLLAFVSIAVLVRPMVANVAALLVIAIVYCANHRRRLSNHLLLTVALLSVCVAESIALPTSPDASKRVVASLLVVVYFFGFFHKLNKGFLSGEISCANIYMRSFFKSRSKLLNAKIIPASLPWLIIAYEFFLFLGFGFSTDYPLLVAIALPLHYIFGLTGNAHFSVMIYAMFAVLLGGQANLSLQNVALGLGAVAATSVLADRSRFRHPEAAGLVLSIFGLVTGYCLALVIGRVAPEGLNWPIFMDWRWTSELSWYVQFVLVVMLINGFAPYVGKTEFSLAMFSNIRPDLDNHLLVKRFSPSKFLSSEYYEILDIVTDENIRNCHIATVRLMILSLDENCDFYYRKLYVNECLRIACRHSFKLSLHVRRFGSDQSQWLRQDDRLEFESLAQRLCFNPPYLSKSNESPYMG